jgi:DNA polymerase III epsilon subunit-like protein
VEIGLLLSESVNRPRPCDTFRAAIRWTTLRRFLGAMLQGELSLAGMAAALGQSEDYRVLRRLIPRSITVSPIDEAAKTGILLDVETTGLDLQKDEIIELGMVKFDYLPDGRIVGVRDVFTCFNEPSVQIPLEVTALTGITDEMVAGHRIDEAAVESFVGGAVIVIAHNAGFDRKFVERFWPVFQRKAWGCSATEVEWRKHGFEGSRLGYLLNGAGFFRTEPSTTATLFWKSSRSNCRPQARRRLRCCWSRRAGRRYGSGPSSRRSI